MILLAAVVAIFTGTAIWAGEYAARRLSIPLFVTRQSRGPRSNGCAASFRSAFPGICSATAPTATCELIQFAEFTGVYGVSALIVFFNAVVYAVLFARYSIRARIWSLSALTASMLAALIFGTLRIAQIEHAGRQGTLKVAMVQGNIPQTRQVEAREFLATSFQRLHRSERARGASRAPT